MKKLKKHALILKESIYETSIKISHELQLFDVTAAMNACLTHNSFGEKDTEGMPSACKEICKRYAELAGFPALQETKNAYLKNIDYKK